MIPLKGHFTIFTVADDPPSDERDHPFDHSRQTMAEGMLFLLLLKVCLFRLLFCPIVVQLCLVDCLTFPWSSSAQL